MAGFNSSSGPFDAFQQAIKTAIPIYLQKKRLEFAKQQEDREFERLMEEARNKNIMELVKLKDAKDKAADKITADLYMHALKTGNLDLAGATGPGMEQMGVDVPKAELQGPVRPGESLERYLVPEVAEKPEEFNEKAMLWLKSGENVKKYIGLRQALKSKGISLEVGPDRSFTFTQGGPQDQPTKTTRTKLQQGAIGTTEGLARVSQIAQSFDPSFLEIPTRLGVSWNKVKDLMGVKLEPGQQQRLEKFSVFKQNALENINLYIKEITGAQMSEKEANRLRQAMPDPGEGWFDGDSPRTFQAKLINTYKKLNAANMRYNYYLKQGIGEKTIRQWVKNGNAMSFDQFKKIIDGRGKQIEKEIRDKFPDASTQDIFNQVKARLKEEFGAY